VRRRWRRGINNNNNNKNKNNNLQQKSVKCLAVGLVNRRREFLPLLVGPLSIFATAIWFVISIDVMTSPPNFIDMQTTQKSLDEDKFLYFLSDCWGI